MCVIIYSGIDYSHPNLEGCFSVGENGEKKYADFVNEDQGGKDYNGHGTHVAGE